MLFRSDGNKQTSEDVFDYDRYGNMITHSTRAYASPHVLTTRTEYSSDGLYMLRTMIEKGISRMKHPVQDVQAAIENTGNIEIAKMENGLAIVSTIASGAPMIGFLGTVTGMVKAFFEMANAGNNIDITLLSGGIYEAMITTVGGLMPWSSWET